MNGAYPEKLLGYRFRDEGLITTALTHRSYGSNNNERLEFLGDGLLNAVIAAELYKAKPGVSEGDLSRLRASLVRESAIARIARDLNLGDFILLGQGEAGSQRRDSVLADAFEAVLAAIYLDGGFNEVEKAICRFYAPYMRNLPDPESLKDPKTRLQEYLQSRSLPIPEYEVIHSSGPPHKRHFRVECRVSDKKWLSKGEGSSRRKAEQAAADSLLKKIQDEG